ncbi:MAG: porin family protein [Hyphomicrobiaceae bacterium]|nr:porin family protein [Hyphomicrobiaceae bacterium]
MSKKQAVFAALAILSCGSPAFAADLWQPSVKDEGIYEQRSRWDGFYLGLNGGYAFADTNNAPFNDAGTPVASLGDLGAEGGFGGGQIGYNYVTGRLLLGVEADVQAADIGDSTGSAFGDASTQIDAFGTVRGRIGFVSDRTLIYATGGYAWADVDSRFSTGAFSISESDVLDGYVVGGGLEYALTDNWSAKLEYQYVDLEDRRLSIGDASTKIDPDFHTVRAGLNYRF